MHVVCPRPLVCVAVVDPGFPAAVANVLGPAVPAGEEKSAVVHNGEAVA